MKKQSNLILFFRESFSLKKMLLCFFIAINFLAQTQISPPGAEFKKVDWRDKDITNTPGLSQVLSGDEWWYSHKTLYDPMTGKQIGYIAAGYISDIVHPGDDQKMRNAFNEGTDSPYNWYDVLTSNYFISPIRNNGACTDFYNYMDATSTVNAAEMGTPFRGIVARLDMNGKMLWCKITNISGGGLQELTQDGQFIYVIGTHDGVKTTALSNKHFIPYNPASAGTATSNIFSTATTINSAPAFNAGNFHMYVAKLDLDGNKKWEGLYGAYDFSNNADSAYWHFSLGADLIINSQDHHIYAVGKVRSPTTPSLQPLFVAKIDTATGYLLTSTLLPIPAVTNYSGQPCQYIEPKTICEIGTTGSMVIGGIAEFDGSNSGFYDWHHGIVYSINQSLSMNPGWPTNPIEFPAASGAQHTSIIWDINYHTANNEVLVGLITDCDFCHSGGQNLGYGKIWRLAGSDGHTVVGNNPLDVGNGPISAFDLRLGVIETPADGGYAAVSTQKTGTYSPPTSAVLGPFTTCISIPVPSFWDSDPIIVKYDNAGNTMWTWSEDVVPGRPRVLSPGDTKRQECMYKISSTDDGGLAISGNASFNHDDFYLVKLYSDCQQQITTYSIIGFPTSISTNTTWNTPQTVYGQVVVQPGNTLTIDGATIRFADGKATNVEGGIKVMPGARLNVINGALLTSIDNTVCPGSMWDGIIAVGTNSNQGAGASNYTNVPHQGLVTISSSTISNARRAIITGSPGIASVNGSTPVYPGPGGGVVRCDDTYFINNETDIECWDYYGNANKTVFNTCHFLINNTLNSGNQPVQRVFLQGTRGINLNGCEFAYNAGSAYDPMNRGFGIQSNNSVFTVKDYSVTQSTFSNFTRGIFANNVTPLQTLSIDHAIFTNTFTGASAATSGIVLVSPYAAAITNNNITFADQQGEGIYIINCQNYSVRNNTITYSNSGGSTTGIYITSSGAGAHKAYRNTCSNLAVGIQPQWANSGFSTNAGDHNDGLLMNCNTFTNNSWDIRMAGNSSVGIHAPSVRANQGVINSLSSPNPTLLVRNQYAASCGLSNKWYIQNGSKIIQHAVNSDVVCQPTPQPSCSSTLVTNINSGIALNFTLYCPENESTPPTNTATPPGSMRLTDIGIALSGALARTSGLNSTYANTIDGGNTPDLLMQIQNASDISALKSFLLPFSPYLSDTVLKGFFYIAAFNGNSSDLIELHNLNRPVTPDVWAFMQTLLLPGDVFDTLNVHQALDPISARRAMEDELGNAKAELQFIYSEKLNYFLRDTLDASPDTVIKLLSENLGNLPTAPALQVNAYANINNYTRAFAFADSLGEIDKYTELMTLQKVILQLDTAQGRYLKILTDSDLNDIITDYAADSTKQGSYLARAILYEVYGKEIPLVRLPISDDEGVKLMNQSNDLSQSESSQAESRGANRLSMYPNPTDNSFSLLYKSSDGTDTYYTIKDILGKEVASGIINPNVSHEINARPFNNGIYFVTLIQHNKLVEKQKLVIMK